MPDVEVQTASASRLTGRQSMVLRTVVGAFVGEAGPIGSPTLVRLLPESLSPASIRNTLAELTAMGLIRKPHRSAGSVPTDQGLRYFVDRLLDLPRITDVERREIAGSFLAATGDGVMRHTSQMLSERTHQLGFVVPPRLDRLVLKHVTLVRLAEGKVLMVLVSRTGIAHRRVLRDDGWGDQAELDRVASALNERIAGRTLHEMRNLLAREAQSLRHHANRLAERAVRIGAQALAATEDEEGDLVIATRLALLDQPEFQDPSQLRQLFEAVETRENLVAVLDDMLDSQGVRVAFGWENEQTGLEHCAIVAAPYGSETEPLGVVGVLGPNRMNYGRVISLVDYLSRIITEQLAA